MSLLHSREHAFSGINFKKMLNNLASSWDGTELVDWLKELIDNGIDASKNIFNDKIISLCTEDNKIIYEDNMNGMDAHGLNRLVEFFTDDKSKNEDSIGRFGIGAKKAILALIDISSTSIYSDNKKSVTIISKQNNNTISIKIDYSDITTLSEYEQMLNENFNNEASELWNKYYSHEQSSGTIIIIETSDEMVESINMLNNRDGYELDLNYRLLDISRTYNIYIKNGLKLFINRYKVPPYVHNEDSDITHTYKILIKKNHDGSYIYETQNKNKEKMQCKKTRGKYTNCLKPAPPNDGFEIIGKYDLRCSMNMRMGQIINNDLKFDKTHIDDKFRTFVKNITNNSIEDEELINMYYKYLKEAQVIRGLRYLGCLPVDAPRNLTKDSSNIFNLISKSISFTNRMDGILKLTQSNKSNITWKGTLPAFKRMTYLVTNLFRKEYVSNYYKSLESNLKLLKVVNGAVDMAKNANIYSRSVINHCDKFISKQTDFYDRLRENTQKIVLAQSLVRKKHANKQYTKKIYKAQLHQIRIRTFTKNVHANKIIKCTSKYLDIKHKPYKRIVKLAKKFKKLTNKPSNKLTEKDKYNINRLDELFEIWGI